MRASFSGGSRPDDIATVQQQSFSSFLDGSHPEGWSLEGAFKRHLPITDPSRRFTVGFEGISLKEDDQGQVSIRAVLTVTHWSGEPRSVREIVRSTIDLGHVPSLSDDGTFLVNGIRKVLVPQIRRSTGPVFSQTPAGPVSRILTDRGPWADITVKRNVLSVSLDKRRGDVNLISFLRTLDLEVSTIVERLAVDVFEATVSDEQSLSFQRAGGAARLWRDIPKAEKSGRTCSVGAGSDALSKIMVVDPIFCSRSASLIVSPGSVATEIDFSRLQKGAVIRLAPLAANRVLHNTAYKSTSQSLADVTLSVFSRMINPAVSPSVDSATQAINRIVSTQSVGLNGRRRLVKRFGLSDADLTFTGVRPEDYLLVGRYLLELIDSTTSSKKNRVRIADLDVPMEFDDIDSLANRRVYLAGEAFGRQADVALARCARLIKETLFELSTKSGDDIIGPADVFPASVFKQVMREIYTSALMQMADETNPLSTVAHLSRLTALGPGGLRSADRASTEVRDVHVTHFGRICPIQTPEGPNVGLVTALSVGAVIEEDGSILAPYRSISTGEVELISTETEVDCVIAINDLSASVENDLVPARIGHGYGSARAKDVTHCLLRPDQVLSISAATVPFLECDDANRALMGANMAGQAVPLSKPEPPLVGTGIETLIARRAPNNLRARRPGRIVHADARTIVVETKNKDNPFDLYRLIKHEATNQGTVISHTCRVEVGQAVTAGELLADGPASVNGEIALGRNLVAAYMPFHGLNFEDAIVVSERVAREGMFSSTHIVDLSLDVRVYQNIGKGKPACDEVTNKIDGVSEARLAKLDEQGIIRVGSHVSPGDVLVGRVSPRREEEDDVGQLIAQLFGKATSKWHPTPLTCPNDIKGTVVDVRVVERDLDHTETRVVRDSEIDRIREEFDLLKRLTRARFRRKSARFPKRRHKYKTLQKYTLEELDKKLEEKIAHRSADDLAPGVIKTITIKIAVTYELEVGDKLALRHGNKGVISRILPDCDMPFLDDGTPVDIILNPLGVPSRMNIGQILEIHAGFGLWKLGEKVSNLAWEYLYGYRSKAKTAILKALRPVFRKDQAAFEKIRAMKTQNLCELCLNFKRGVPVATPAFDGMKEADILAIFRAAGLNHEPVRESNGVIRRPGQVWLHDGLTGDRFTNPVTVGIIYVQKLHHLVADKMHARSTGPYSAVTQQPLGGRAQFGGQRLGEMEVWAIEAYGAAYTLQETLGIRSDDVTGREEAFKAIVRGRPISLAGTPAAFEVLRGELQALALDVEGIVIPAGEES